MPRVVITEDASTPGGEARVVEAEYLLIGEHSRPLSGATWTETGETIAGRTRVAADATGHTTIAVPPTAELIPEGTRYLRRLLINGRVASEWYLDVPDGGPFLIADVRSDEPGAIIDPDVETELRQRVVDLEAAILALGGQVGGAVPVTSVNEQLGPDVVLTPQIIGAATAVDLATVAAAVQGLTEALAELTAAAVVSDDIDELDVVAAAPGAPDPRTWYVITPP